MAQDTLASMLATAEGQEAYIKWFGSDITQHYLAKMRQLSRPVLLMNSGAGALDRAEELGRIAGVNQILDLIERPHIVGSQTAIPLSTETAGIRPEDPIKLAGLKASYGADKILKETGNA